MVVVNQTTTATRALSWGASRHLNTYHRQALQTFCAVRAVLAFGAAATLYTVKAGETRAALSIAVVYAVITLVTLAVAIGVRVAEQRQLVAAIAIDLVFVVALVSSVGGASSAYAMLYFLPIAGAALLSSRRTALFVAALATVALLVDSVARYARQPVDVSLFQSGALGAAMLAVSFVLNDLARRVSLQERLALQRQAALQAQIETNQLVIQDMPQGILVLTADAEIRAANPAARAILGWEPDGAPAWAALDRHPVLASLLREWIDTPARQVRARDIVIDASTEREDARSLTTTMPLTMRPRVIRARSLPTPGENAPMVVYLEDLREVEAQAVQMKLASMGRLTANIAHEIRNPLAAIAHASELLSEDLADPGKARLIRIVQDNVHRLDRIVGDVLSVSRSTRARAEVFDLAATLTSIVENFARAQRLARERFSIDAATSVRLTFDRTHFEQIVANLLSNAVRHASNRDGSIVIRATINADGDVEVRVADDGPGVDPAIGHQLFEPFFTTHRSGTGLGLYVARELAIANHATLFLDRHGAQTRGACFTLRIPPMR